MEPRTRRSGFFFWVLSEYLRAAPSKLHPALHAAHGQHKEQLPQRDLPPIPPSSLSFAGPVFSSGPDYALLCQYEHTRSFASAAATQTGSSQTLRETRQEHLDGAAACSRVQHRGEPKVSLQTTAAAKDVATSHLVITASRVKPCAHDDSSTETGASHTKVPRRRNNNERRARRDG